jgi:hypothetical protein
MRRQNRFGKASDEAVILSFDRAAKAAALAQDVRT